MAERVNEREEQEDDRLKKLLKKNGFPVIELHKDKGNKIRVKKGSVRNTHGITRSEILKEASSWLDSNEMKLVFKDGQEVPTNFNLIEHMQQHSMSYPSKARVHERLYLIEEDLITELQQLHLQEESAQRTHDEVARLKDENKLLLQKNEQLTMRNEQLTSELRTAHNTIREQQTKLDELERNRAPQAHQFPLTPPFLEDDTVIEEQERPSGQFF